MTKREATPRYRATISSRDSSYRVTLYRTDTERRVCRLYCDPTLWTKFLGPLLWAAGVELPATVTPLQGVGGDVGRNS